MTEQELRELLRDWMTEIGVTITERRDAIEYVVTYVVRVNTTLKYDAYDRAMTYAEKRLGLTIPTSVDSHDLLFEYAAKIWLCGRILARQVGSFDVNDKKGSQVFKSVKDQRDILQKEYEELREEIWGKGVSQRRTTTGDLEIATHSMVSAHQTDIDNEDVLELTNEMESS